MTTPNPHSTALVNPVGSLATAAATTSAVVVASSKVTDKAVSAMAKEVQAVSAATVRAVKAGLVVADKAANPTPFAPVLTHWASAAATAVAVAAAEVVNPVVAVGALTRCARALAASNKLAA